MNKELWLKAAKEAGIEDFEIYEQKSKTTSIRVYQENVDRYTISECNGIAVRGIYKGNMGIYFLEQDDDELMNHALSQIKENAEAITSEDIVDIYPGDDKYPVIEQRTCTLIDQKDEVKIELLKEIESRLKKSDKRIDQVMSVSYGEVSGQTAIDNTKGIHLQDEQHVAFISAGVMAKDQEDTKVAYDWKYIYNLADIDVEKFTQNLSKKVLDKLHAESVESGTYPVLIDREAMADILEAFCGMFDGENAHKGISLLHDRLGENIFSEDITIVDDPFMKDGYNCHSFDDEGVACQKTTLVDNGVLKSYLHNLKSARLMDCKTTGNGFKGGYSTNVGIAPTNLYIQNGNHSVEEMIASMDKGIIITEVTGLHAGLRPLTGDFSLQSEGWYVENGKKVRPVNLITIAGNFMKAMNEISMVGNDGKLNADAIGSPSILFSALAVSGN